MFRQPLPPGVSTVNVPLPGHSGVSLPHGINALPAPPAPPVSSIANLPPGVTTLSVPVNNSGSLPPGVTAVPVPHEVVLRMLAESAARSNHHQQHQQ